MPLKKTTDKQDEEVRIKIRLPRKFVEEINRRIGAGRYTKTEVEYRRGQLIRQALLRELLNNPNLVVLGQEARIRCGLDRHLKMKAETAGQLDIDSQKTIARCLELREEGKSYAEIVRTLDAERIRTNMGRRWQWPTLKKFIEHHPEYEKIPFKSQEVKRHAESADLEPDE